MTTSKDSEGSAPSATPRPAETQSAQAALFAFLYRSSERFLASHAAFPLLLALFALDSLTPALEGGLLLVGLLAVSGLCAEEYIGYLRTEGLKAPPSLGFYAALMPLLIATCWRPTTVEQVPLGILTAATFALVFCALMVALSLIAEVSERMLRGLVVFCLGCAGALVLGGAFTHLLVMRQMLLGLPSPGRSAFLMPLIVLAAGWAWAVAMDITRPKEAPLRLVARYAGLAAASVVAFWITRASIS